MDNSIRGDTCRHLHRSTTTPGSASALEPERDRENAPATQYAPETGYVPPSVSPPASLPRPYHVIPAGHRTASRVGSDECLCLDVFHVCGLEHQRRVPTWLSPPVLSAVRRTESRRRTSNPIGTEPQNETATEQRRQPRQSRKQDLVEEAGDKLRAQKDESSASRRAKRGRRKEPPALPAARRSL